MNSIRSFGAVFFLQFGVVLLAQDHKRAPPLQIVLDHIAAASAIYGDSVLHPQSDEMKGHYADSGGMVVNWTDELLPLRVRTYSHGEHHGVWYRLDSAGTVMVVDSFPIAGEIGKRYTYREDGTIETIFPIFPTSKRSFDLIFGGYEFGDHFYFDKVGRLRKKITFHDHGPLETHIVYSIDGKIIYSRVLGGKWEIHKFWCIHERSLGSLTKDCISGTCKIQGTMFVWSKEFSAYYKVTFKRNRNTLQSSDGGPKMSFNTLDDLSSRMRDLDVSDAFWRNEIEFESLPCTHKQ